LLLVLSLLAAGCSVTVTTSTTLVGVDDAPEVVKSTFVMVTSRAAALAGQEITRTELLDFARAVCAAGIDDSEDLSDFVEEWAGPDAGTVVTQMWITAGGAATSSFCPGG